MSLTIQKLYMNHKLFTVAVKLDSLKFEYVAYINTKQRVFYINISTEPIVREQRSQVLCHGECTGLLKVQQECVWMIMTFHCLLCGEM